MTKDKSIARWTGAVYLVVVVCGMFSLAYVPGQLRAPGDPEAMLGHVMAHQGLFKAGVASFLLEQLAFLVLPFLLYRLFARVQRQVAAAMVVLAVMAIPLALLAAAHRLDALSVLTDPAFASLASLDVRQALALHAMEAYEHAIFSASLFWGLWLLPFGALVIRSNQLPKVLGFALFLGGFGYVANVFGELLITGYEAYSFSDYATLSAAFGEIGTCLWLLCVGLRARPADDT